MSNKTIKTKKGISLMALGGVALLVAAFALPMQQAYAVCSKSAGSTTTTSTSTTTSSTGSPTLVCVSRSSVLTTQGLDSASARGSSSKKATICHIPPGNAAAQHTLSVAQSSVSAHMAHGDTMGACSSVTQAYIESLPSCTAIGGSSTTPGVWLPDNTVGNDIALNAYLAQVQGGISSGHPESFNQSYREIRGQ